MNRLVLGALLGVALGAVDVALMVPLRLPDRRTAMLGAFLDRFAIGFLAAQTEMPIAFWARGMLVGLLVSLPSAVVTRKHVPILVVGILGGAACGWAASSS